MVIDGYVVKLDLPELRELALKMKSISNSETKLPSVLIPPAISMKQILKKSKIIKKKFMRASEKSSHYFPR